MNTADVLVILAMALGFTHFSVPIAYYWYLKRRWLNNPWNIKIDHDYKPKIAIIIPTYMEADLIEKKLENIYEQDYPKNRIKVVVVDSASTDGTPEKVKHWSKLHQDLELELLLEPVRRGMVPALNYALRNVSDDAEIVVFTDVDAFLPKDALRHVVKYFTDDRVGAVTLSVHPLNEAKEHEPEEVYRSYYNVVRVGESKIHSTPIHNGAFVAFRKRLLDSIGGLPTYTGNNDSTPASLIAFMGYRAIQVDYVAVHEPVRGSYFKRKIRRAQHLILHFINTKRYAKKLGIYRKTGFDKIWRIEAFLHLVNPWLLLVALILLLASLSMKSFTAFILLLLGTTLTLAHNSFRTWILNQLFLVTAFVRNLWTKEIAWSR